MENAQKKSNKGKMSGLRWNPSEIAWLARHKVEIQFCAKNDIVMDFEKFKDGYFTKKDHPPASSV